MSTCLYHIPKSSPFFLIVIPKESKLPGFWRRSSDVDCNFVVPGVFALATGTTAFPEDEELGTVADVGVESVLPRMGKESSLMGTDVEVRYLLKSE